MYLCSKSAFWYQGGLEQNILIILETGKNQYFEKKLTVEEICRKVGNLISKLKNNCKK